MNHSSVDKRSKAAIELVFGSMIWGFGFIATRWAMQSISPIGINVLRFGLAFIFAMPAILIFPKSRKSINFSQFQLAILPGLFLSLTLLLQTIGLKYTTVTNSGFITCMYVLFVPLTEAVFLKRRISITHTFFVGVALIGAALICRFNPFNGHWSFNKGDLFTIACAIAASFQIVRVDLAMKRMDNAFIFNAYQSFWAGTFSIFILLAGTTPLSTAPMNTLSSIGICSLGFGSTLLAFFLQVRAQKVIAPSTASMIFLLESPFAAVFAYFIFKEQIGATQWIGAALILISSIGAVHSQTSK